MSSKGGGTALTRRNYRLASDMDKPRSTGIVNEKMLSDYLHHNKIFSVPLSSFPAALGFRKPLGFQDLPAHLEKLLSEDTPTEDGQAVDGRLGPQPVVLDHTSGFEGLLFVDDDLLGVIGHSNFSSIRATTCVYKGKWAYEVLISSQGLMQIGWCTLSCRFNQEGVGDTPDSYAYDGNRVRKWNVTTTNYGKSWAAGDIVSCLIDLDEGTITFCLNGQSLGTAFTNIKMGPGIAYFPAISLSFKESVAFNFGSRPLRYPSQLINPPAADLMKAHKLLGYIKNVLSTAIDAQEERLVEKDCAVWRLHGEPTVLVTLAHIFNHFAPLMCKVYLVEDVLMNFLLGILEGGGSVDEHPLIQQLLDLFWLLMEDHEVNECLKQLMMSLLRAYRFSPIIPDLGFQIHYLRLTTAILRHEKSRKYLLSNLTFDVLRSVVFFYIKTPLRVKEAGLEELIPTTWWPTHFDKEGKDEREPKDESADERLRRRAYERGCQRLKKRIEVVEELQVQILRLLLNNKDKSTGEASRYIFLNKFRKFLQENASNRGHPTALCPPEYMVCFLHRLITAVRGCWDEGHRKSPSSSCARLMLAFFCRQLDETQLMDDLASKANIIIDPAEIQATSMDDLDEDDESGAAQRLPGAVAMGGALARPSWLSSPTLGRANRFLSTAAVSLMTPRRPLSQPEKVKVRTLAVEQRTEEDSEYNSLLLRNSRVEQGEMVKNIDHDIYLKICNNDITDDITDARQNTTPQHY
uniref:E3 ubiquitin-protein ligase RNF123-like n=1 Tax=Pundamilia nyererei TaxID=303518 RepID=A0A3B4GV13_9CICH